MKKSVKIILMVLIAVGILACSTVAFDRLQAEKNANSTMLALEWSQISDTAARTGMTVDETLDYYKNYGDGDLFTGVLYKEPAFSDLEDNGTISIIGGNEFSQRISTDNWTTSSPLEVKENYNYIICNDSAIQDMVYKNLENKTDALIEKITAQSGANVMYVVGTSLPSSDFATLGTGFPQENIDALEDNGVGVILQVRSWPNVTQESIDAVYDDLATINGIVSMGFNDDNLPGVNQTNWNEVSQMLADKFDEHGWPLCQCEFFSQKGLSTVAKLMGYNVSRLHAVPSEEMKTLTAAAIVDRFQLAANERGMNVIVYRADTALSAEDNAIILQDVKNAIEAKGRNVGDMIPMESVTIPIWVGILAALGIGAGGVLLLERLYFKKWAYILPAVGVVISWAAIFIGQSALMYKLLALAAVMIFPMLAIITFIKPDGRTMVKSILALILMTLASLIGAVFVIGLLSTRDYMTAISVFSGIKVSQMLPLVILAMFYWYQTNLLKGYNSNLVVMTRDLLKKSVSVAVLVVLAFAAGVLLLYMLRSGNDAISVSDMEKAFRSFLDSTLQVRPRTKEFMFAHPLMLLVLYFGFRKNLWPAVVLGAIGQVSLVNTFEHLHTPIAVSLLRTFNGLLLGIIIGIVLILVVKVVLQWLNKKMAEPATTFEINNN